VVTEAGAAEAADELHEPAEVVVADGFPKRSVAQVGDGNLQYNDWGVTRNHRAPGRHPGNLALGIESHGGGEFPAMVWMPIGHTSEHSRAPHPCTQFPCTR
jgi:hypothetical protein